MNERDYLIWLSSVPGLSLKRQKKMIKIFGSAHDIWTAPEKLILMLDEFPKNILEKNVYICITESLYYTAETYTTL